MILECFLGQDNLDYVQLERLARDLGEFIGLKEPVFAKKGAGTAVDIQIFDFSSKTTSTEPWKIVEYEGGFVPVGLVGDALIEPFWPLGTGANRAVLGVLDLAWSLYRYHIHHHDHNTPLEDIQKEAVKDFKTLSSSSPNDLNTYSTSSTTIEPTSRYKKTSLF